MSLAEYLEEDLLIPDLKAQNKIDVLNELLQVLTNKYANIDLKKNLNILVEREKLGSTGIGDGVAIPHGKTDDLDRIVLVVGRSLQGVDFEAIDHKPCYIFFLVLAPEQVAGMHLRILAHISRVLKDPEFRQSFLNANGADNLWHLLKSI